jgi:tetratricopeptide (TPR) repeat protein
MRHATLSLLRSLALAAGLILAAPLCASTPSAATSPAAADVAVADRLDDDPAAKYLPLPISDTTVSAPQRERLRAIERGLRHRPDHPGLLSARGFIRYQRGEADAAEADFARAIELVGTDELTRRHVLWSLGWARFEGGQDEAALAAWRESMRLHGGRPYWLPYSAALAEWRLGRRDVAVALYDVAARGIPDWRTPEGFARRTHAWPAHQVELAQAVFDAWRTGQGVSAPNAAP